MEALVEMKNIRKEFSGVVALDSVSFDVRPGEVHLLLGENGAGKSTLMKILSGIYTPTKGTILLGGNEFSELSPKKSKEMGISIIYQELSVVNDLSIAENLFVGKLPTKKWLSAIPVVDKAAYMKKAEETAKRVGLTKPVTTNVGQLSISEKQLVEIAKALVENSKLLVMDEPTSSLTEEETKNLFKIINELRSSGIGIVYISHKMKELKEIGDRVTVLKDGKTVGTKDMADIHSEEEIISMMVGRELQKTFFGEKDVEYTPENIVFKAEHISRKDGKTKDISFELYKGEVLGVAGLVGAGRTELMNAFFAGESYEKGDIWLNGKKVPVGTPYTSIKNGIAMITENRRETGIFPNFGIKENLVLVNRLLKSKWGGFYGAIHPKWDQELAEKEREEMQVKCSSLAQMITELSGGNQQKVIVGKWMAANAEMIIFDEPTKGIDIGTKTEMYRIMRELAQKGIGVIMISSEMPELLGICDRIMVLNDGRLKGILNKDEVTEEKILQTATM
ncbi:MAG: sugar ABC transporter ATP-binding protein [Lachnospiraceae bacterium]|jgi:D-allose transport system ATP-binding protein|nr:sugar ABC transporter ATP-binding protein [Lachnospiraceae bacterium]